MKDATKLKQVQTVIMKRKQQKSNDMGIMVLGQEVWGEKSVTTV